MFAGSVTRSASSARLSISARALDSRRSYSASGNAGICNLLSPVDGRDPGRLRGPPAFQQLRLQVVDLHPDGAAAGHGVRALLAPAPLREVAAGARRDGAEEVDLGEQLEEVALPGGAGLHEVDLVDRVEAGDLEHVQHVVHVELGQV